MKKIKIRINCDLLAAAKRKAGIFALMQFAVMLLFRKIIFTAAWDLPGGYQTVIGMMGVLFTLIAGAIVILFGWDIIIYPVYYSYLVETGKIEGFLGVNPFKNNYIPQTREGDEIRSLNILYSRYCLFNPAIEKIKILTHYLEAFAVVCLGIFLTGSGMADLFYSILFAGMIFVYIGLISLGSEEFLKYLPAPLVESEKKIHC